MFGIREEYAERWQMKPFTSCCDVLYGYPFDSQLFNDDGKGMPLIRVRDINTGFSNTYTTEEVSPIYQVHDGDILVGMDGDFNAKVWSSGTALLNQRTCKMKGKDGIVNDLFMLYYLNPELLKIHRNTASTTVKHLSAKEINKMQMPLPPKELQDQFAVFVEQVDKSKFIAKQAAEKYDQLVKSRFIEMFGDPIRNEKGLPSKLLKDCCSKITNGTTPKGGSQVYVDSGILFFRSQNIWRNRFDLEDVAYTNAESLGQFPSLFPPSYNQ